MKKVPISLIIDDPAPAISVYYDNVVPPITRDGRPIIQTYPNSMLNDFCDIVERWGIKGKFSIVPMPANKGDISIGLEGIDQHEVEEWLSIVKMRLIPAFSIGPEMLTHYKAIDIETGSDLDIREDEWSFLQDRTTLTPYISRALSILSDVGIKSTGVTSPWVFGIKVEDEYVQAISRAVKDVSKSDASWYFCRNLRNRPNAKPWIALEEDGRAVVSIPATASDVTWQTIDSVDTSEEYVHQIADELISIDGKSGQIIKILQTGGYPILIAHWQSLASNGLYTGLRVLDEVGRRINLLLSDCVEWMSYEEIMHLVIANKSEYPAPRFDE